MAEKKDNTLGWIALAVGVGVVGYALLSDSGQGSGNPLQVPAGASLNTPWGQWTNTTGAPVWATATGIITNGAGQLLGNIADLINAINQGQNSNTNNSSGGNVGKTRIGDSIYKPYYNPLPGGLM